MTIKRILILSHLVVFIVPIIMTLLVIVVSSLGLITFARNGNHIYIENAAEFKHSYEVVRHIVFSDDDSFVGYWLIGLLAPEQNFILVTQNDKNVFSYGNDFLLGLVENPHMDSLENDSAFISTRENKFVYLEKQTVNGKNFFLCFISECSLYDKDKALEAAVQTTIYFVIASLLIFVLATSLLLSGFILKNILLPLRELRTGAEKIKDGELEITLRHSSDNEIKSIREAFNFMAQKLSESLKEIKRQEESRKELVADISHDLRTPLTTIKAYVEGLLDNVADTPEKKIRYLRVIKKKSDEMNDLIEQLFLFSKMSLGEKAVPFEPVDLKNLLEFFVSENLCVWQKQYANVSLHIESNAKIFGSPLLLERILSNIISNSIKYRSEEDLLCRIRLKVENQRAVLSISDNGIGVSEDSLKKLTEPFYRTDKARSHTENGTGLGLSIALKAVEMMHGSLFLKNVQPHGLSVIG